MKLTVGVGASLLFSGLTAFAAGPSSQGHSWLLGGQEPEDFVPEPLDPVFPLGDRMVWRERPSGAFRRWCSATLPVCVHVAPPVDHGAALALFESSYRRVVLLSGAPGALGDGSRGGGPELDLYVAAGSQGLEVVPEAAGLLGDEAAAFCVVGAARLSSVVTTRCLAEAAALAVDASETPALRGGLGSYVSWIVEGPDDEAHVQVDAAQANPQITLWSREAHAFSDASALVWAFVDQRWGDGQGVALPFSLLQLSRRSDRWATAGVSEETRRAPRWLNEPDVLDVVRRTLDSDSTKEARLVNDFAVARMFLGDRSDGAHPPNLEWLGPAGRVRFDWTLEASTLPRNIISNRAIEPLGSFYAWIDLRGMGGAERLGVRVGWEEPVRFSWLAVGIDAEGREVTRWEFPLMDDTFELERTLMDWGRSTAIALIGTNLGGVDRTHPFDPDSEPWEPHRATVYVTRLE